MNDLTFLENENGELITARSLSRSITPSRSLGPAPHIRSPYSRGRLYSRPGSFPRKQCRRTPSASRSCLPHRSGRTRHNLDCRSCRSWRGPLRNEG
ncbi:hypothetical protein BC629DRAFT_1452082 [Irpex lacteus]|nr:hypothetical protein BC629DRAFT_1452082 [Irpex lacteus]